MSVAETHRPILRRLELTDAEFIFKLVNDPTWLAGIGDRGVEAPGAHSSSARRAA